MVVFSFKRAEVSKLSRDRLWSAVILQSHNMIPKVMPEVLSSIEFDGDGGDGTIKKFVYAEGLKEFPFTTYKMDKVDEEKHTVKFSVIDGGFPLPRLKSLLTDATFDVGSNDVETLVKFIIEYETSDDIPLSAGEEDHIYSFLVLMLKAVNEYLDANPTS